MLLLKSSERLAGGVKQETGPPGPAAKGSSAVTRYFQIFLPELSSTQVIPEEYESL